MHVTKRKGERERVINRKRDKECERKITWKGR